MFKLAGVESWKRGRAKYLESATTFFGKWIGDGGTDCRAMGLPLKSSLSP